MRNEGINSNHTTEKKKEDIQQFEVLKGLVQFFLVRCTVLWNVFCSLCHHKCTLFLCFLQIMIHGAPFPHFLLKLHILFSVIAFLKISWFFDKQQLSPDSLRMTTENQKVSFFSTNLQALSCEKYPWSTFAKLLPLIKIIVYDRVTVKLDVQI